MAIGVDVLDAIPIWLNAGLWGLLGAGSLEGQLVALERAAI